MKKGFYLLFVVGLAFGLASCSSKSGGTAASGDGSVDQAQKMWGSERVCLPCHLFQQPIARKHHYRCDTCHLGNPWTEDKDEAHYNLVRNPQAPQNIDRTCDKCHRRVLGTDVPYNADFIKDVIVSHKRKPGENLEWSE